MFVRFVVGGDGESHRVLTGLITEARLLRDSELLAPHEDEQLEAAFAWFNKNLPCPPFTSSKLSKNAVTWFKDDAGESIRKIRELVVLLETHDKPVRMLRSRNPGKVVYEDPYQAVVEEWKKL